MIPTDDDMRTTIRTLSHWARIDGTVGDESEAHLLWVAASIMGRKLTALEEWNEEQRVAGWRTN